MRYGREFARLMKHIVGFYSEPNLYAILREMFSCGSASILTSTINFELMRS